MCIRANNSDINILTEPRTGICHYFYDNLLGSKQIISTVRGKSQTIFSQSNSFSAQ